MLWGFQVNITEENVMDPHAHDIHELVVCISRTGRHLVGNETFDFQPGLTIFLPSGIMHQAIGSQLEPAEIAFVSFDQQSLIRYTSPDLQETIAALIIGKRYISGSDPDILKKNLQLSDALQKELTLTQSLGQSMAGCLVAHLLINHYRSLQVEIEYSGDKNAKKIADVCNHITSFPESSVSLEQMAKKTGMSRTLFSESFRKHTGMSLIEFTLTVRINTAMKLLAGSNKPIIEIAYECGFYNIGYFYRAFRRIVTMTPGKYRRQAMAHGTHPILEIIENYAQ